MHWPQFPVSTYYTFNFFAVFLFFTIIKNPVADAFISISDYLFRIHSKIGPLGRIFTGGDQEVKKALNLEKTIGQRAKFKDEEFKNAQIL